MNFIQRTIVYIGISLTVLLALSGIGYWMGADTFILSLTDISAFDLLTSQIANTLIVLSLTSVLSTNFGQVYWMDVRETKLITPFFGCFIGITVYLLTGLVFAMASYGLSFSAGVLVAFVYSVILLIFLTFKMIGIYFGKEALKKQLSVEYKRILVLVNSPYISDYVRRLEKSVPEFEKISFSHKGRVLKKIRNEIKDLKEKLDSSDEKEVEKAHKEHIDKYIAVQQRLKELDAKIIEYTRSAIAVNDYEVIRENVEILVESENFTTFFGLVEDLFEWDEKYTCSMLKKVSDKNGAWLVKDKLNYFKQYALKKMIADSGRIDAIQNLLMIYDAENSGLSRVQGSIREIVESAHNLAKEKTNLERELSKAEDLFEGMRAQKAKRKEIEEGFQALKERLITLLDGCSVKEKRNFYVPLREAYMAYLEGQYEIANRYLEVILLNFQKDKLMLETESGMSDIEAVIRLEYSYVTEEEMLLINRLLQRDAEVGVILQRTKQVLSGMSKVVISNKPMAEIT